MNTTPPIQYSGPVIDASVPWDVRRHLQLLYQKLGNHTQAFKILAAKSGTSTTVSEIITGSSGGGAAQSGGSSVTGIPVNNQSGETSYATVNGDNQAMIVFSDASPIAVSLVGQTPPWGCYISNQGSGTATLTPASGTISYSGNPGASSMPVPAGAFALVAFDGANWWSSLEQIGVTSLNGESGALMLVAGANVSVTPSGSNITIASSGGSGGTTNGNNANGYWEKLYTGRIMQWGSFTAGAGDYTLTFPIPFTVLASISVPDPSAIYPSGDTGYFTQVAGTKSLTEVTFHQNNVSSMAADWFAIGY